MKSHCHEFALRDLVRLVAFPLAPVAIFAALMHVGARFELLPNPRPTLDVERTVLVQRVEAARSVSAAEILLVGDSSCLMNVSALQLERELGRPVLNLATFSFLDLASHAALVREYARANPGRLKMVVLLQHPDTLRRLGPERHYTNVLAHLIAGEDVPPASGFEAQLRHALGLEYFQSRVVAHVLPAPLPGAYGRRYGFTHDLEAHLEGERGSLIDPDPVPFGKRPEYRLAVTLEKSSQAFRAALPDSVTLVVGMTPVPEALAGDPFRKWQREALARWADWLQPSVALTNLPSVLPDEVFTRPTHLREGTIPSYTKTLADGLRSFRIPGP